MPKTLADYSPDERAQMVGMWCDVDGYTSPAVLTDLLSNYGAVTILPHIGKQYILPQRLVTPRFELPPAWQPDGTPLDVDVEQDTVQPHPRGGIIGDYTNPSYTNFPVGTKVRRYVAEWEIAEEEK